MDNDNDSSLSVQPRSRDWHARCAVAGSVLVVLLLGGGIYFLQTPQINIQITGAPGTPFVGNVTVDGSAKLISGEVPVTLKYRARHVAFNVLPAAGVDSAFGVHIDHHEITGATGVGGWFDARRVIPEVKLIPLDAGEFERLAAQYRNISGKLQPALPPATAAPAPNAASE